MPKTAISPHGVKDPIGAVLAAKCFDETGGTATAREVQQGNGYDCGAFAIAFATSLAYGEDPSKLSYDTKQLRNHLRACMESNRLTPFPSTKCAGNRSRRETMATEDVHCSCRRSEYMVGSDEMVECDVCKEWYHKSCVPNYPRSVKKIWKCQQCKSKV